MITLRLLLLAPRKITPSFIAEKEKTQQNINEIDTAMTKNNVEITNFIPPTVRSEHEIRKRNRQDNESFMQTKIEIDERDLDAIERADSENKEKLMRNNVNPTEGLTVNDEPNIAQPLQLPPNVNAIVYEIKIMY